MEFLPPPHPPRVLSDDQMLALAQNGWISYELPQHILESLEKVSAASKEFFRLSAETKAQTYPQADGTECGYYSVENEKEYVTLRSRVHEPSHLEHAAAKLWSEITALLHRMLCDLAREMDLPHDIWDKLTDGCLSLPQDASKMTPTLLRLFQYFPKSGFAAKHTDLGFLTLCVGDGRGLQVLKPGSSDQWVDADGPVILAGEVLRILSINRIRAGQHRVVENPNGRSSIVFALRPSLRHDIDLDQFGIGGSISAEELWKQIHTRKMNINATKEIREKQREEMKARKESIQRMG